MKQSNKYKLRMYAGNLSGLYGIRDIIYNDGRGKGARAIDLKSDNGVACTVLTDRCMDIPYMSFKGINIGLVTKVGISSPQYYVEDNLRGFLKQFNAGLLTTCGIVASGAPSEVDEREFGLHGNISNTPAENVNTFEQDINDEVVLTITGDIKEVCVFGEALVLHRTICLYTEQNILRVEDTIENQGFEDQPLMNLYHINFGYPMADENARCYSSMPDVAPRDKASDIEKYHIMDIPQVGKPEECFMHSGAEGKQFAMIHNSKLGIAGIVHFDASALPFLGQWKCCHAGDYAIAFEPSIAGYWGLKYAKGNGHVRYIKPGEKVKLSFGIELLDDPGKIHAYKSKCKEYNKYLGDLL